MRLASQERVAYTMRLRRWARTSNWARHSVSVVWCGGPHGRMETGQDRSAGGRTYHKARHFVGLDELGVLEELHVSADVFLEVGEGEEFHGAQVSGALRCAIERELRRDAHTRLLVGEGNHAAVRVLDDDDFLSAQHLLADHKRAERIGRPATRVPDNVRLPKAHAKLHAGQDARVLCRVWRSVSQSASQLVSRPAQHAAAAEGGGGEGEKRTMQVTMAVLCDGRTGSWCPSWLSA